MQFFNFFKIFKNIFKKKYLILTTGALFAFLLLIGGCRNNSSEEEKTPVVLEEIKPVPKEFLYSKMLKTSVMSTPDTAGEISDILGKNTRVLVLERQDIEINGSETYEKNIISENQTENSEIKNIKINKSEKPFVNDDKKVNIIFVDNVSEDEKQEENSEVINVPDIPKEYEHWVHIKYRKDLEEREGWILEKNLTAHVYENLPQTWDGLQLNNFPEKIEFEDNPRVTVKGIYVSIFSASSEKKIDALIKLAKESEINTFVIDVKEDNGHLLWKMNDEILKYNPKAFSKVYVRDIEKFMKKLKDNNIYTIARIVSFKDPMYAKQNPDKAIIEKKTGKPFVNKDGIIWVSPYDRNLWEYNIAVAKEAAKAGFNEIQFDYVRFPASNGGKLDNFLDYRNTGKDSKPAAIQKYLKYAWEELTPYHVYINADVYGQIGTFKDDMGLGQYWEAVSGYVHYISPMMYPSHYTRGAYGIPVPDADPYKTIYYSALDSVNRNENIDNPAVIRPWIQDFTAKWVKGYIKYDVKEIKAQIKALNDLGIEEYLLWSPSNRYHVEEITSE